MDKTNRYHARNAWQADGNCCLNAAFCAAHVVSVSEELNIWKTVHVYKILLHISFRLSTVLICTS